MSLDRALPRIFRPSPWQNIYFGGYSLKPTQLVKVYENQDHEEALERADLSRVFSALNYIQDQAWCLNRPLIELQKSIWESGGGKADIPLRHWSFEGQIKSFDFLIREQKQQKKGALAKEEIFRLQQAQN